MARRKKNNKSGGKGNPINPNDPQDKKNQGIPFWKWFSPLALGAHLMGGGAGNNPQIGGNGPIPGAPISGGNGNPINPGNPMNPGNPGNPINPGNPMNPGNPTNLTNINMGNPQDLQNQGIPAWKWLSPLALAAHFVSKGNGNNPQGGGNGGGNGRVAGAPAGWPGGEPIPGTTPLGLLGVDPDSDFFFGDKPRSLLFQQYFPGQQKALQSVLESSLLGLGQNPADFGPIEENARTQFSQRTLPSILERFNAMGGERSSAFPEILGSASKDLESDLAAQRGQYNLAQNELLQRLLQIGLTPQVESIYAPRQPGFLQGLAGPAAQAAGAYFGGR